jgi:phosphatidylinositol alpha-1,6-mannosyltransferase
MKILLITDNFLPHFGGSRVYYYNLCKSLPKGSITVLTRQIPGAKEFDQKQDFHIYRIKFWTLVWKWTKVYELPMYFCLLASGLYVALKEKIDIIHCGEALPSGFIGFLVSKILGKPYLIYTWAEEIAITPKFRTEAKLMCCALRNADRIIATCAFVAELTHKCGVATWRIAKVTPGINVEFLNYNSASIDGFKRVLGLEGKKIILTTARLVKRKGHEKVIEALPQVLKSIPNTVYLIVGSGPEEERLRALVKEKGIDSYIHFYPEADHTRLLLYYLACDLFVMPNRQLEDGDTEGFGIVFVEANAFGKPVIGGRYGGTADSIIDGVTGIRVDSENSTEIGKAIITLLADEGYARTLGEAGKKRAKEEFRWQDKATKIYAISQEILDAKGA